MPKKGKTSGKAEVEKKEETKKEPEVAADKKGNGKNKGGKGKKKWGTAPLRNKLAGWKEKSG